LELSAMIRCAFLISESHLMYDGTKRDDSNRILVNLKDEFNVQVGNALKKILSRKCHPSLPV
jgi:hypothetical protein